MFCLHGRGGRRLFTHQFQVLWFDISCHLQTACNDRCVYCCIANSGFTIDLLSLIYSGYCVISHCSQWSSGFPTYPQMLIIVHTIKLEHKLSRYLGARS